MLLDGLQGGGEVVQPLRVERSEAEYEDGRQGQGVNGQSRLLGCNKDYSTRKGQTVFV